MAEINVAQLYFTAFGFSAQRYDVDMTNHSQPEQPLAKLDYQDYSGALNGVPLFMPCQLDGVQLPNEPIIEISGGKRMVTTPIDGNDGTFKELYSIDDYKITIRGVCVQTDGSNEYPEQQVRQLHELYKQKKELRIMNALATIFGIEYISIQDMQLPAIEGVTGAQPYIISALSDKPTVLEINKNGIPIT